MKIHFAFGQLWKKGLIEQQCSEFLNHILGEKRLKVSVCTEFLPRFPIPRMRIDSNGQLITSYELDLTKAEVPTDGEHKGSIGFDMFDEKYYKKQSHINYRPVDVAMISFIDIPFNKLPHSNHSHEYGKLGIVLTDDFYKRHGLKHVQYYTEQDVYTDKYIKQWNDNFENKALSKEKLNSLVNDITLFRKPACLFDNFARSVTVELGSGEVKFNTYNRYPKMYNFTKERECRIAFTHKEEFLNFSEHDVYMVIVPSENDKKRVETFIKSAWEKVPIVKVYPE